MHLAKAHLIAQQIRLDEQAIVRAAPPARTGGVPAPSGASAQLRVGGLCQAAFAGPRQVLDYVGRYTHRIAISNSRLLSIDDGKVRFRWKDYRHGSQQKTMTLDANEFIRRFLIHVLPDGFQRICYYGFLGNCHRTRKLALCRELLAMQPAAPAASGLPEVRGCRFPPIVESMGSGKRKGRSLGVLWRFAGVLPRRVVVLPWLVSSPVSDRRGRNRQRI